MLVQFLGDSFAALILYWVALGDAHAAVPEEDVPLCILLTKMSFLMILPTNSLGRTQCVCDKLWSNVLLYLPCIP